MAISWVKITGLSIKWSKQAGGFVNSIGILPYSYNTRFYVFGTPTGDAAAHPVNATCSGTNTVGLAGNNVRTTSALTVTGIDIVAIGY